MNDASAGQADMLLAHGSYVLNIIPKQTNQMVATCHLCSQEEATIVSLQARVHLTFWFKFYCAIKSRHARKRAYYTVLLCNKI